MLSRLNNRGEATLVLALLGIIVLGGILFIISARIAADKEVPVVISPTPIVTTTTPTLEPTPTDAPIEQLEEVIP